MDLRHLWLGQRPRCERRKELREGGTGIARYQESRSLLGPGGSQIELSLPVRVVKKFAGPTFTIGDGRDGGAGGRTNANGADISAGAVGFSGCTVG